MSKPTRNADSAHRLDNDRTFFATSKMYRGQRLLQSERNASLLIDVLRTCVSKRAFRVHDFVIMPDHIHLLITVDGSTTIERAMQLIKGGFSYRLKKDHGYLGEVWQRGFSDARVEDRASYERYRQYIASNPVKAGLANSALEYPYTYFSLARQKAQGLKPIGNNSHRHG